MIETDSTYLDEEDPKKIEERNNRKLTADKIKQILTKVKNDQSGSAKRWVWELMQNAKDLPKTVFDRVSIQILYSDHRLEFKHNGDPFTLQNIFSLIQQVSSKDSANQDKEVTGKFGTGFIATHLLSEIIHVKGVVRHKGIYRQFDIDLDRRGETSEALLPKIESALDHCRKVEDDSLFPKIHNYENNRSEDSYDTVFSYPLTTEEQKKAASAGIDDLINTLPMTLVNIPSIKRVEVLDKIAKTQSIYASRNPIPDGLISKHEVEIYLDDRKLSKRYLTLRKDSVVLTTEVEDFESFKLIEKSKEAPSLYRDFPLIGSEKFYFPFYLNGTRFHPTEDRDGIFLHSQEGDIYKENRNILETAWQAADEFTNWLIEHKAKHLFSLAQSRFPKEKWEDFSKAWYKDLQIERRSFLRDSQILENQTGTMSILKDSYIPNFGEDSETKELFYKIVLPFLGPEKMPAEKNNLDWIKYTGPKDEIESWSYNIYYDLDDLLRDVANLKNVSELNEVLKSDDSFSWLNTLFKFISTKKETEKFAEFAIIPDHHGTFQLISDLHLEDKSSVIPDELLDIQVKLGDDWRTEIIHRKIDLYNLNIDKKSLSDLSEEINSVLKKKSENQYNQTDYVFLQRDDALEILVDILRCVPFQYGTDSFKNSIYSYGKKLFGLENEFREVTNTEGFRFDLSLNLFIRLANQKLEEIGSLDQLASEFDQDLSSASSWLNEYLLKLESKEDFKALLEYGNIIPNRYGAFEAFESLNEYGTEENPLDESLLNILKELDSDEDWRVRLVHEAITIKMPAVIKMDELGSKIRELVSEIEKDELSEGGALNANKSVLLDLIQWVNDHEELAIKYLDSIKKNSSELFFKLTLRDSGLSIDDIKLLNDEDSRQLLKSINNSSINKSDLNELLKVVNDIGSVSKLLEQAKEIREEQENMRFLLAIGEKVENAMRLALEESMKVKIHHDGRGAFDFEVTNASNGKSYFIELKSYRNYSSDSFRLAPSQAIRAAKNETNYALALLERPDNIDDVTTDYIKENLKFRKEVGYELQQGLEDYLSYREIAKREGTVSKLHLVLLEKERIEVERSIILSKSDGFSDLMRDIKRQVYG